MAEYQYHPIPADLREFANELEALGGGDARVGQLELIARIFPRGQWDQAATKPTVWVEDPTTIAIRDDSLGLAASFRRFQVTRALGPELSEAAVAEAAGKAPLEWLWQGFNANVVATGQQGSGKSCTLFGQEPWGPLCGGGDGHNIRRSDFSGKAAKAGWCGKEGSAGCGGVAGSVLRALFQRIKLAAKKDSSLGNGGGGRGVGGAKSVALPLTADLLNGPARQRHPRQRHAVGVSAWEVCGDSPCRDLLKHACEPPLSPLRSSNDTQWNLEGAGGGEGHGKNRPSAAAAAAAARGGGFTTIQCRTLEEAFSVLREACRVSSNWQEEEGSLESDDDDDDEGGNRKRVRLRCAPNRSHFFVRLCLLDSGVSGGGGGVSGVGGSGNAGSCSGVGGVLSTLHLVDLAGTPKATTPSAVLLPPPPPSYYTYPSSTKPMTTASSVPLGSDAESVRRFATGRSLHTFHKVLRELSSASSATAPAAASSASRGDEAGADDNGEGPPQQQSLEEQHRQSVRRRVLTSSRECELMRVLGPLLSGNAKTWLLATLAEGSSGEVGEAGARRVEAAAAAVAATRTLSDASRAAGSGCPFDGGGRSSQVATACVRVRGVDLSSLQMRQIPPKTQTQTLTTRPSGQRATLSERSGCATLDKALFEPLAGKSVGGRDQKDACNGDVGGSTVGDDGDTQIEQPLSSPPAPANQQQPPPSTPVLLQNEIHRIVDSLLVVSPPPLSLQDIANGLLFQGVGERASVSTEEMEEKWKKEEEGRADKSGGEAFSKAAAAAATTNTHVRFEDLVNDEILPPPIIERHGYYQSINDANDDEKEEDEEEEEPIWPLASPEQSVVSTAENEEGEDLPDDLRVLGNATEAMVARTAAVAGGSGMAGGLDFASTLSHCDQFTRSCGGDDDGERGGGDDDGGAGADEDAHNNAANNAAFDQINGERQQQRQEQQEQEQQQRHQQSGDAGSSSSSEERALLAEARAAEAEKVAEDATRVAEAAVRSAAEARAQFQAALEAEVARLTALSSASPRSGPRKSSDAQGGSFGGGELFDDNGSDSTAGPLTPRSLSAAALLMECRIELDESKLQVLSLKRKCRRLAEAQHVGAVLGEAEEECAKQRDLVAALQHTNAHLLSRLAQQEGQRGQEVEHGESSGGVGGRHRHPQNQNQNLAPPGHNKQPQPPQQQEQPKTRTQPKEKERPKIEATARAKSSYYSSAHTLAASVAEAEAQDEADREARRRRRQPPSSSTAAVAASAARKQTQRLRWLEEQVALFEACKKSMAAHKAVAEASQRRLQQAVTTVEAVEASGVASGLECAHLVSALERETSRADSAEEAEGSLRQKHQRLLSEFASLSATHEHATLALERGTRAAQFVAKHTAATSATGACTGDRHATPTLRTSGALGGSGGAATAPLWGIGWGFGEGQAASNNKPTQPPPPAPTTVSTTGGGGGGGGGGSGTTEDKQEWRRNHHLAQSLQNTTTADLIEASKAPLRSATTAGQRQQPKYRTPRDLRLASNGPDHTITQKARRNMP